MSVACQAPVLNPIHFLLSLHPDKHKDLHSVMDNAPETVRQWHLQAAATSRLSPCRYKINSSVYREAE